MSWLFGSSGGGQKLSKAALAKSIFDFEVKGGDGSMVALSSLKGKKAYLIVNVASQ